MNDANPNIEATYKALAQDGLVLMSSNSITTSKRWQLALAQAALDISEQECIDNSQSNDSSNDFRLPIVMALMTLYQSNHKNQTLSEKDMTDRVDVLLRLEVEYLQSLLQTQH